MRVTPLLIIMVHLVKKVKKGHVYLYLAERARVGGKSKQVWQQYLGPEERIKDYTALASREDVKTETIEFGLVAALLQVARRLDLMGIVNRSAGKRSQGLSVGEHVLLAAINRCVHPVPKAQLRQWLEATPLRKVYPALPASFGPGSYWAHFRYLDAECVEQASAELARAAVDKFGVKTSDVLFDATNFFTHINPDPARPDQVLPRHGHPKDGRATLNLVNVSLFCALDGGVPLLHLVYPGNEQDAKHFKTALRKLQARLPAAGVPLDTVTLVFDKGNLSDEAFSLLDTEGLAYLASVRPSSHKDLLKVPPAEFAMHVLPNGKTVGVKEFRRDLYGKERRLVATYNPRQAAWLRKNLVAKVQKKIAAVEEFFASRLNSTRWSEVARVAAKCQQLLGAGRFRDLVQVEVTGAAGDLSVSVTASPAGLDAACQRFGKSFLVTSREDLPPEAVVWAYRQQHVVETAFKLLKGAQYLSVRPMWHWVDASIRGHVFACVVGLLLLVLLARELRRTGTLMGMSRVIRCLREIQVTRVSYPGGSKVTEHLNEMSPEARQIYDALHLEALL